MADFSFSEDTELQRLNAQVIEDPEEFEHWEKLVRACESQEGGLNRNSTPSAITATRNVYDALLARFPLFFGYWKKYADLEFSIAGTEAAEMVYERGIASVGTSVDLWANYCAFKVDTSHDADVIRELFERGADSVGLDFLAHPFWDKYLEYEERMEQEERVFALLERIIHIPLHQYSRYFERYHTKAARLPTSRLVSAELLAQFTEEATRAAAVQQKGAADIEQDIRTRIGASQVELFHRTQAETGKRWTYEQEVKRPYYHVTELDEDQLSNWRKYLDFEEAEGDYSRIRFLYERCLVTAANYQEFWLRYARWMSAHPGKEQEVRNIYQRACCIYVPIARPEIRLYYAYFEEAQGKPDTAMEILDGVLMTTPGHTASIVELANIHRRHTGLEAAISELQRYIDNEQTAAHTRGALVSEHARLLWKFKGTPKEARKIYESHRDKCLDCRSFWVNWLQFEIEQPTSLTEEPKRYKHIKSVFDDIRRSWTFSQDLIKEVTATYFHYLQERGGKDQIAEFIELDREMNGPPSVKGNAKKASAPSTEGAPSLGAGPTATANHQPTLQSLYPNGPTLPAR